MRMCAWFIIHHYRAEDPASKAALIRLLTGCQANKTHNKRVCETWSRCAHNKVKKQSSTRGRLPMKPSTSSLPKQPKKAAFSSKINWKHKTNRTKQAWTFLCFFLSWLHLFHWHLILTNPKHPALHREGSSSSTSQPSYSIQRTISHKVKERGLRHPLLCWNYPAVIIEKPQKHSVLIWQARQRNNAYIYFQQRSAPVAAKLQQKHRQLLMKVSVNLHWNIKA